MRCAGGTWLAFDSSRSQSFTSPDFEAKGYPSWTGESNGQPVTKVLL